uniref:Putative ribonuclease H-like domain-containing protein n=1 Tax=Tanacetum cinerariifolium TaxID=118510 RepID=A0A6L2NGA9_TANCI|nr:putative ribonuclease H-like domain-containing protein [Tanacetum cinerariifolium]
MTRRDITLVRKLVDELKAARNQLVVFRTANVSGVGMGSAGVLMVSILRNAVVYWSHGWRQLVSIKYVTGCKPLALPWGRTPRLDSGVSVRQHVIRVAGVGPLSGKVRGNHGYGHGLSSADVNYSANDLRKWPVTDPRLSCCIRVMASGSSQNNIDDKHYWDSGCSRHMTGNISYLSDFEPFDGGYVSFGQGGCKITGKGTIKTGKLEFENVYFIKDLKYNLFSVSQICDNKNSVLFTDSECIVLGRNFKLLDDANILLRTPRQHNMYLIDLNNIVSYKDITCLVAKVSSDKCILWHRRLGHLNVKTMNKLVRLNLVRGLPTKSFDNDHTCTACLKGKQHKASCKSKLVNSVTQPLHTLHIDLFGPTSVSSISHKWYCLVVTDDFSRFTWTFFLRSKDETSDILKKLITEIENLKDLKVKIIRYWLSVGAQPSDPVQRLLFRAGLLPPPPMVVMGRKGGPRDTRPVDPCSGRVLMPEEPAKATTESLDA